MHTFGVEFRVSNIGVGLIIGVEFSGFVWRIKRLGYTIPGSLC